jgi:L-ascorbate metabolism protein UlaG (beta-lactamase superfamily)
MKKILFPLAAICFAFAGSSATAADKPAPTAKPAAAPTPAAGPAAEKPAPAGVTTATWWGHAAWIITTPGGATIAIDPWLDNPSAPKIDHPKTLDAILVTHGHFDHVGNAAELAKKTGAKLITSYELASLIGAPNSEGMNMGGTTTVKDATIHLVEAVHSGGFGQYHAGDTDVFSSMSLIAERYHPTIAMLPIGGHFTMDPSGAALAAKLLKIKTVIPMHFGTFPALAGTPAELRDALKKIKSNAKVDEFKPGESQTLK